MYRPKKPDIPLNQRLPKQQSLTEDTLQFLLSEASSRRGTTLELPFQPPGAPLYLITVKLAEDASEPTWTYMIGDDARAQVLWRHMTGDVNLVYNLCSVESGGSASYTAVTPNPSATNQPKSAPTPPPDKHNTTTLDLHGQSASSTLRDLQPVSNRTTGSMGKTATMQGDLSNMQIPTLLQSVQMSKMTGWLQLEGSGTAASIYFEDGLPTHATTSETIGDQAIVEIITWEEGSFHFYPNESSTERTVKRRVDGLLMEGIALLDQNKYCKEKGLKLQSYLIRLNPNISEEDFTSALTRGAPLDLAKQKKFYSQIDNASTVLDILRRMPMIKNEWVPLMFNMLACGLVTLSDTPPAGVVIAQALNIPPFEIDRAAIQGVVRQLTRPETGILHYPVLIYLMELEFAKCAALGMPLSVIVFEPKLKVGDQVQALPIQYLRELMRRLEQYKRQFDGLGHFEMFDYAMFMPNTPAKSAKVFVVRLMEIFGSDPFIPRPMGQLSLYTGIAAAPEDTQELSMLLAAAKDAKRHSVESGNLISLFRENQTR
jgi:hypothetical protein